MPEFLLPDLGEGLADAEIVSWRVQAGDRVEVDQVIVEVETAKAAVEVPVPFAGVVARLHAEPGGTVAVGQPLITIAAEETTAGDSSDGGAGGFREPGTVTPPQANGTHAGPPETTATTTVTTTAATAAAGPLSGEPGPAAEPAAEASGNVLVGYGTAATPRRGRRAARRASLRAATQTAPAAPPQTRPAPVAPRTQPHQAAPRTQPGAAAPRTGPVPVISPLVRKMARDAGLDLAGITGTGPSGLVRREDVARELARRAARQPAGQPAGGADPGERRIPLRGVRRTVADRMTRSRREIPEATVWVDVDATGLLEARRVLNAQRPGQPVSLLGLVARFAVLGLRRYPELNGRVEPDEIVIPGHVHLGFAAQTGRGLLVPVVHDAHRLSARELSAALDGRTAQARDGSLAPADLTGGTFTVNNYGVFGVDGSAAIINHPEVAILGIGRIIDRPWVAGSAVVPRKIGELTLAFDHRVCDGGTAGGFLRYVADCIESPVLSIGDL